MNLSIIVTVYNKENFLERCLDSLLFQKGEFEDEYEIIIVNDGSTDSSLAICEKYKAKFPQIKLITQTNQGLSMARNNGVDAAIGDYVWFVDADDTIAKDSVSLICKTAKSNADVLPIYAQTSGIDCIRNKISVEAKTGKDVLLGRKWQHCGVFYVYRRGFLKQNALCFMPGIYHEDSEFTPRMLYAAKTVKVIPYVLYIVYRDPNGITQVPRAKRAFDYLIVAEKLALFLKDNNEEGTEIGKVMNYEISVVINNALFYISKHNKTEKTKFNKAFYDKRDLFIHTLKNASQIKFQLEAFLFVFFPKHYVELYKFMKII